MSSSPTSTADTDGSGGSRTRPPGNTDREDGPRRRGGKGFLEVAPGQESPLRAMSIGALVVSIIFGTLAVTGSGADPVGIYITIGLLLTAFAPKTVQKFSRDARAA